jgi:inner membrane protein
MDSLTQIALGASLSVAVMGRRTAVWKSALWGGLAGLLPDLDVIVDHGDAILNMIRHRGPSHSLLWLTLLAPALAYLAWRLPDGSGGHRGMPASWRRWCLALWLALFTHPLLDLMTIYGTQVLQPWTDEAWGLGSIFIIDPLYTLPLLGGLLLAGVFRRAERGLRANALGLLISSSYLAWSALAQASVEDHARDSLAAAGLPSSRLLVTPAPLQTVLWRVVALEEGRYHEGYYSFRDGGRPIRFRTFERGAPLLAAHAHEAPVQGLQRFADGFVRMAQEGGRLWITDLRMGQEPDYVFHFDIGPVAGRADSSVPALQVSARTPLGPGLRWLGQRMLGHDVDPPGLAPEAQAPRGVGCRIEAQSVPASPMTCDLRLDLAGGGAAQGASGVE